MKKLFILGTLAGIGFGVAKLLKTKMKDTGKTPEPAAE